MLAMDEGDVPAAEHWFRQAILLKEIFRAALFNLALLLADDHRPLQAAPFLNQLVRFHPDHVKALILLGDIYINNIKDLDAAENVSLFTAEPLQSLASLNLILLPLQCYQRILQLDPDNTQGMHNLCVVYVERGLLKEAETCLQKAHLMAPHEDYIVKHLKIVQNRLQAKQTPDQLNVSSTPNFYTTHKFILFKSVSYVFFIYRRVARILRKSEKLKKIQLVQIPI